MTTMTTDNQPKSAYEKVRDAMAADTAAQSSEDLCKLLLILDKAEKGEAEKIVEAVISDELMKRHPEADAASLRWSEDPEATETITEVIVEAVLRALEDQDNESPSTCETPAEVGYCWICGEDGHSPTERCAREAGMY